MVQQILKWIAAWSVWDHLRAVLGFDDDLRLMAARDEYLKQRLELLEAWLTNIDKVVFRLDPERQPERQETEAMPDGVSAAAGESASTRGTTTRDQAESRRLAEEIRARMAAMKQPFPTDPAELSK